MTEHAADAPPSAAPEMTVGKIIDEMLIIRDKRTELEKKSKELKEEFEALETILLGRMLAQDARQTRSTTATATVSEKVVPTVRSWDEFERYILDNNALYMLQRRPSTTAFRELHQAGEVIPGVEAYNERTILLRRL